MKLKGNCCLASLVSNTPVRAATRTTMADVSVFLSRLQRPFLEQRCWRSNKPCLFLPCLDGGGHLTQPAPGANPSDPCGCALKTHSNSKEWRCVALAQTWHLNKKSYVVIVVVYTCLLRREQFGNGRAIMCHGWVCCLTVAGHIRQRRTQQSGFPDSRCCQPQHRHKWVATWGEPFQIPVFAVHMFVSPKSLASEKQCRNLSVRQHVKQPPRGLRGHFFRLSGGSPGPASARSAWRGGSERWWKAQSLNNAMNQTVTSKFTRSGWASAIKNLSSLLVLTHHQLLNPLRKPSTWWFSLGLCHWDHKVAVSSYRC